MNKYLFGAFILLIATITGSCEKGSDGGGDNEPEITEIFLEINKGKILSDNNDNVVVIVKDQDGFNISGKAEIYFDDKLISGVSVRTNLSGRHNIYAKYKNLLSNTVEIEAIEDTGFEYNKNILVEQFTGTWCGWCPRAIYNIDNLSKADNGIVHIGFHLNDEMAYYNNSALFQSFGFTGVPSVKVDRKIDWEGAISEVVSLHKPVRTGLSVSVAESSGMVDIDIRITFGIIYPEGLKLTVYLVEDSLVYSQKNFYNSDSSSPWYQKGELMTGFVHKNVMVKTVTNMFGDNIPASSIDIGSNYEASFSVSTSRVTNIDNLKAVVIVSYAGGSSKGEAVNCIICPVGRTKESTPAH